VNRTGAKSFDVLIIIAHAPLVAQMGYYYIACFNALTSTIMNLYLGELFFTNNEGIYNHEKLRIHRE